MVLGSSYVGVFRGPGKPHIKSFVGTSIRAL